MISNLPRSVYLTLGGEINPYCNAYAFPCVYISDRLWEANKNIFCYLLHLYLLSFCFCLSQPDSMSENLFCFCFFFVWFLWNNWLKGTGGLNSNWKLLHLLATSFEVLFCRTRLLPAVMYISNNALSMLFPCFLLILKFTQLSLLW